MCGIAGVFWSGEVPAGIIDGLRSMLHSQKHRGPDDRGEIGFSHARLAHCRLSIIDTSGAGHQPMLNLTKSLAIAFNGEIYNYRELAGELKALGHQFRSTSDTEVILAGYEAWGPSILLKRLQGMYAFAIYDERPSSPTVHRPLLFLARDPLGIKPLYYARLPGGGLTFASEAKALCRSGLIAASENPTAWMSFLAYGFIPGVSTPYREISALPPGHHALVSSPSWTPTPHFDVHSLFIAPTANVSDDEYCESLRVAFEAAVDRHLISDAPLGIFLSGGLDSSLVAAAAARRHPHVRTISVAIDGSADSEQRFQDVVASHCKTDHSRVESLASLDRDLSAFVDCMDLPTIDGLNTYLVARGAAQAGVKTVLSGLGADELFCGYVSIPRSVYLSRFRWVLRSLAGLFGLWSHPHRRLAFLRPRLGTGEYLAQRGLFTPREVAEILGTSEEQAWAVLDQQGTATAILDAPRRQQYLDFAHYMTNQLLRDADVFGMCHSIEIRVPFLDLEIVRLALSLAPGRHTRPRPKALLTSAAQSYLPTSILEREKHPFSLPMRQWLSETGPKLPTQATSMGHPAESRIWSKFYRGKCHWSLPWALHVMRSLRARTTSVP